MDARGGFNGEGRTMGLFPSALIVLALVALLLVPVVIQREVGEIRAEIQEAADPARTAVTRIQYLLARQTSSLRGFFISRDSSYLGSYRALADREREVQDQLERMVRRLGNDPLAFSVELRGLSNRWHDELEEELREGAGVAPGEIPYESGLYLAALDAASRLDDALAQATRERREAIEAAERRARWLQVGLGVLALAAALSTAWLSRRVQRLAAEAEARRHEAEQALAETARAVESKARLIRGVTHDVKNPLGAADGYAELLEMGLKGELTPAQTRVVAGIRRSIHGALEIIQDLLDLSRAEAGDLQVEHRPVRLNRLVEEVVEEYRGSADASGHTLELVASPGDLVALTDGVRVRQILGNLLANAIKYTPGRGQIRVAVGLEPNGSGPRPGRWACVRVADTGPGIRPEDRDRIFEEFQRLSETTVRGHGLGLSISRRLAHLLDGDITVESEVGRGSTFVLWLPGEIGD
jgi:signal transduction histidine kinase